MQRLTCFLAVILAFAAYASASDVVVLTPDNFDSLVDGSRPAFIEFYAPWCGHCKRLAPEYDLVGSAYKNKAGVLVAKVDCDEHRDLCGRFDVSGYPTLKWFQTDSDVQPYSGGRTAEDIIKFINSKTGLKARVPGAAPSEVVTLTPSNFDKVVLDNKKDVFVKFYAPWCGHCKKLEPTYEDFARVFGNEENVVVARVDCDEHRDVCSRFDVSGYPTLKFFPKNSKSDPTPYNGDRDIEGLVNFINKNSGTKRLTSGSLDETAGILDQFADLIETFRGSEDKSSVVAEAEKLAGSIGTKMAKVYQRAFQQIAQNAEYVKNEVARLERMIGSGSLSSQKIDEFTMRSNILRQFQ